MSFSGGALVAGPPVPFLLPVVGAAGPGVPGPPGLPGGVGSPPPPLSGGTQVSFCRGIQVSPTDALRIGARIGRYFGKRTAIVALRTWQFVSYLIVSNQTGASMRKRTHPPVFAGSNLYRTSS